MTLVLRYVDADRIIHVADQRITEAYGVGEPEYTDDSVKAFTVRGSLVISFSGLAELSGDLSTQQWVDEELKSVDTKDLTEALDGMADRLSTVIDPDLKGEPLDIRLTGVAVNGEGELLVVSGFIHNLKYGAPTNSFSAGAEHHVVPEGRPYTSYGAWLPPSMGALLDGLITPSTETIDIANHFLQAIRQTALVNDGVGKTAVGIVVPLTVYSGDLSDGLIVAVSRSGQIAEGRISIALAKESSEQFVLVPESETRIVVTDGPLEIDPFNSGSQSASGPRLNT